MAKKSNVKKYKDYFGLNRIVSIILAIIPVTSWILGAITRFKEKKIVAGLIRLIFGFTVVWVLDIIFMILKGSIFRLLAI
ncbi:MAG: hypothetical protein IKC37_04575 [Clostridia bacterium]|nr:hypothetical protein [Clostridia bacterium]